MYFVSRLVFLLSSRDLWYISARSLRDSATEKLLGPERTRSCASFVLIRRREPLHAPRLGPQELLGFYRRRNGRSGLGQTRRRLGCGFALGRSRLAGLDPSTSQTFAGHNGTAGSHRRFSGCQQSRLSFLHRRSFSWSLWTIL